MKYFLLGLKKYAEFSGRARRAEFWYFILFILIGRIIVRFLDFILGIGHGLGTLGVLELIYLLAMLIPTLSVGVRRLHDINKSGLYYFIPFYNIVLFAKEGNRGTNNYGSDPKDTGNNIEDHLIL